MNNFLAALFLVPSTWFLPQPGSITIPVQETKLEHLRYRSTAGDGYWLPPNLALTKPGTYWVSAATKSVLKRIPAPQFNALLQAEGLTMVSDYRKTYKLEAKEGRVIVATYAKTLLSVGTQPEVTPVSLNLPVEILLRYPTLLELRFRGAPAADVLINLDGKPIGRTNGAGQLPIAPLAAGAKFSASVVRAYMDRTTADWEVFVATLTTPALR